MSTLSDVLEEKQQAVRESDDVLKRTQQVIQTALEKMGYEKEFYELLKEPLRLLTVRIPVRMDDGSVKVFTGYRAQHNDAVGPTKGGVRFHPDVTEEEVKALSMWMSMRPSPAASAYAIRSRFTIAARCTRIKPSGFSNASNWASVRLARWQPVSVVTSA